MVRRQTEETSIIGDVNGLSITEYPAGRLLESERDKIEEAVGVFVKRCSANIEKLQTGLQSPAPSPSKTSTQLSPDLMTHRQGMVRSSSRCRLSSPYTPFPC